jgi:hypothetical protein
MITLVFYHLGKKETFIKNIKFFIHYIIYRDFFMIKLVFYHLGKKETFIKNIKFFINYNKLFFYTALLKKKIPWLLIHTCLNILS